jgi:lipoprotein-releasing system permease protein
MNTAYYIALRLIRSKGNEKSAASSTTTDNTPKSKSSFVGTGPIIAIATASISLGIAVMIIAIAIVTGFKSEIRSKVIGFGSHIQITNFDSNSSFEPSPIDKDQHFYPGLNSVDGIRHIQIYATKAGIIKTGDEIEGVVLKGIGSDFDWGFFNSKIVDGEGLTVVDGDKTNEVLISQYTSDKLNLHVGQNLFMYFIQKEQRIRKFTVAGIYETGLEEFDKLYIIGDIQHIQKLNDWDSGQIGGFEVLIDNFDDLDRLGEYIYNEIGAELFSQTIRESHSQIFDWLDLQNINARIILFLMIFVAGINMVSALLILILNRTKMIGILKAVGAPNWTIRKIFIYVASSLVGKGLLWGNLVGISLCWLQMKYGIIGLDQESYYVSVIPVILEAKSIVLLNLLTLAVCILFLIVPSWIVTRIQPVEAMRFS